VGWTEGFASNFLGLLLSSWTLLLIFLDFIPMQLSWQRPHSANCTEIVPSLGFYIYTQLHHFYCISNIYLCPSYWSISFLRARSRYFAHNISIKSIINKIYILTLLIVIISLNKKVPNCYLLIWSLMVSSLPAPNSQINVSIGMQITTMIMMIHGYRVFTFTRLHVSHFIFFLWYWGLNPRPCSC
jgi:hypothetical protein